MIALCGVVIACSPWRPADVALQGVFAASLAADYQQTRGIVIDGYERNPLIGKHGERIPPVIYFPACFVLHTALMTVLPRPWRTVGQGVGIVVQSWAVWDNRRAGYTLEW